MYEDDYDPLDDYNNRDADQMEEVSEEDFSIWAERYDELNGAPENEEDR